MRRHAAGRRAHRGTGELAKRPALRPAPKGRSPLLASTPPKGLFRQASLRERLRLEGLPEPPPCHRIADAKRRRERGASAPACASRQSRYCGAVARHHCGRIGIQKAESGRGWMEDFRPRVSGGGKSKCHFQSQASGFRCRSGFAPTPLPPCGRGIPSLCACGQRRTTTSSPATELQLRSVSFQRSSNKRPWWVERVHPDRPPPPRPAPGLRHIAAGCGLAPGIRGISACRGRPFDGRPPARGLPIVVRRRGWRRGNFQTSGRVIGKAAPASTTNQGTTAPNSHGGTGAQLRLHGR